MKPQMKLKTLLKKQVQKIKFSKFVLKSKLREKILKIRQNKNKNNIQINFKKVFDIIKKQKINYKNIGGYFPVNFEVDDLEILKNFERKNFKISLPVIKKIFKWIFINGHLLKY